MNYEFRLPWAPSVNDYKSPCNGRLILTKKARDYKKLVIGHMMEIGLYNKLIDYDVKLHLEFHNNTFRDYDIDNFDKAILDSLTNAKFWIDDKQVMYRSALKGDKDDVGYAIKGVKGGYVNVTVSRFEK